MYVCIVEAKCDALVNWPEKRPKCQRLTVGQTGVEIWHFKTFSHFNCNKIFVNMDFPVRNYLALCKCSSGFP